MKYKLKKPLWFSALMTMITPILLMFGLVLVFAYDFKNQNQEVRMNQNEILKNIQSLEFLRINLRKANNSIDLSQSSLAFDNQKEELKKLNLKLMNLTSQKISIANEIDIIEAELTTFNKYKIKNYAVEFENKKIITAIEGIILKLDQVNQINIKNSDSLASNFIVKFFVLTSILFLASLFYLFYRITMVLQDVKKISEVIINSGNNLIEIEAIKTSTEILEINEIMRDLVKNSNLIFRKNAELIEKSKLATIGETTAQIAHEIMNPLAVIVANSNKMKRVNEFDKDQIADLNLKMTDRIIKIVQATKRSVYHDQDDKLVPINIKDIIEEVKVLTTIKSQEKKVKLIFEGNEDVLINCREGQVIQVLLNLINNSMDAIEKLDDRWIKIKMRKIENSIEINVIDSGNGIPTKILENLFSPYFTTKEIGKGTGIGLNLSKKIIKDHGGELIYNEKSENTQFDIILPMFEMKLVA